MLLSGALMGLCSCMHTNHIHEYATRATQHISSYEELPYGFTKHCLESCAMDMRRNLQVVREPFCDCEGYQQADSVTQLLFNTLKNYFSALSQLADGKITDYSFTKLEKSLTAGKFGDITIQKKDVFAYATLTSTLLRVVTDGYRRKKIEEFVEAAHGAVSTLLEQCQWILNNPLATTIRFRKESLYAYHADLIRNNSLSEAEKHKVVSEYISELETTNRYLKQLQVYTKSIHSVASAHQQLFAHRNQLKGSELTKLLAKYAAEINELQEAFQYLSKK